MAKNGMTKAENYNVNPREIDFVSRFGIQFQALLDILGISDVVEKTPGARCRYYDAKVTLDTTEVGEGEETPYSQANVVERFLPEMELEPYAKATTAKAIKDYGYDIAVGKTDEAFLNELQAKVMNSFYGFLKTGSTTAVHPSFQLALAMAKGYVDNEFKKLRLTATGTVGFVNTLDFHEYLGTATVTVQNSYGYNYIKDFMGYDTIFLCSSNEIPRGKVIATAKENLIAYYVNPANGDFGQADLVYATDGVTNFIGFHTQGNYGTNVSECFAIMGLRISAEYLNGIAVVTIEDGGTLGTITAASAVGTNVGTKITVTGDVAENQHVFIKTGGTAPKYLDEVDNTWTELTLDGGAADDVEGLTGKAYVVITNGAGQILSASSAVTITNKA